MKALLAILIVLIFSCSATDLESGSIIGGVLGPLGIFASLVCLCLWIVFRLHKRRVKQTFSSSGGVSKADAGIICGGDGGDCG